MADPDAAGGGPRFLGELLVWAKAACQHPAVLAVTDRRSRAQPTLASPNRFSAPNRLGGAHSAAGATGTAEAAPAAAVHRLARGWCGQGAG